MNKLRFLGQVQKDGILDYPTLAGTVCREFCSSLLPKGSYPASLPLLSFLGLVGVFQLVILSGFPGPVVV